MTAAIVDRPATAVWFAAAARKLTSRARTAGLSVPVSFRSPPRSNAQRSLRRRENGAVVAVKIKGRSAAEVFADMVDGVLAANRCDDAEIRAFLAEPFDH